MSTQYEGQQLYKVLGPGRTNIHGGSMTYPPGAWTPKIEDIEPCYRGYHLAVGLEGVLQYLGQEVWEAKFKGDVIPHNDGQILTKICCQQVRLVRKVPGWDQSIMLWFASDCAEMALHYFESERPDDDRPRRAIEVCRQIAAWAAAGAAGEAAARAAARAAAGAAARAAGAAWAAGEAAGAAAGGAAWAAWAAGEVTRAAWAAARAATRAAGAARAAAGGAAKEQLRQSQISLLQTYLTNLSSGMKRTPRGWE